MQRNFADLQNGPFDMLIIGGGIYGSWTACHAARSGLKVALIEKDDWGSATSQSSSKLLHGGLRYLETYEFGLVRKSLHERRELNRLVPHLVRPLRFLLPVYRDSRVGRWKLKAGLWMYDRLAGSGQPVGPHQSFSAQQIVQTEPALAADQLVGGFSYGDCGTDDARLTLEVVATAIEAGAVACNDVTAQSLLTEGDKVTGAVVRDNSTGAEVEVSAKVVVNAAGPWVFRQFGLEQNTDDVRLTKGVHLVMPALHSDHAVLLTSKQDGRVFFLIPWYGRTLLGTTDTDFKDDPASVRVEPDDISYLLAAANSYLKTPWTTDDIIAAFAGLRTLQNEAGKSASKVSREWAVEETKRGLFTSVGGKYTSARVDAGGILEAVMPRIGRQWDGLKDAAPTVWSPPQPFAKWLSDTIAKATSAGIDAATAQQCARRYGSRMADLISLVQATPDLAKRIAEDVPFCRAEIVLSARDEMPRSLDDLLRRRVPIMLLARLTDGIVSDAASLAAEPLEWDAAEQQRQTADVLKAAESWKPAGWSA
ncbi:glycerol-3-phosphate dehydrogenase/oxidase [Fuerstiella marisgermanici]|uniref:Aerobic glycerol-3-phosphate dehydrogenase n=1 Tax=Fuerstiella marisgermanici TaxID=1891926 RepID=A0A1P8WD58_9PLAN|nr:glycerol-3-phosphate dehydrogenase/oxidase [Fuerstiella marisgermanici]APZ92015.1 Aerobic glycerol-3-phosphate dehydrogenase [Fuerstiella marisgermanici]